MDMRNRLLICGGVLLAWACARSIPVRAEIIISEIMYNPQGTDLDTTVIPNIGREWVELYNTGSTAVNLASWQFGDSQDGEWASAFPANTIIGANQALIVTGDAASFDLEWGGGINRVQVTGFPILANSPSPSNETAAIRNNGGIIVDAVNFDQANGWPPVNGSDGNSISLLPGALSSTANDIGSNWKPSVYGVYGANFRNADGENHGSPGFVASVPQATFGPSPDAAWSMVVLPDIQNYSKSSANKGIFTQMTQWIRDNHDAYKIQVVLQEGDIVNNNNTTTPNSGDQTSTQQWQNAQAGMFVLNGELPYIMATGNHDYGLLNGANEPGNRSTMVNNYFKSTDNPLVNPATGGIMKGQMTLGEIQNAYYEFTAPDGRKMLLIALEWEPRPAAVAWANQIASLPQYADHTAVLLTHDFVTSSSARSTSTTVSADYSGEELWQGLVRQHNNFEIVLNGHHGGDGVGFIDSIANAGNIVHQMFFNSQFETNGGNGWLRLVEFLQDGKTIRIRTYSPHLDLYRTIAEYEFQLQLSSLDILAGDYNRDGAVDAADYVVWRNLNGSSGYYAADGNGDHLVDELDHTYWRQHMGGTAATGVSFVVPEPSIICLLLTALCVQLRWHRGICSIQEMMLRTSFVYSFNVNR